MIVGFLVAPTLERRSSSFYTQLDFLFMSVWFPRLFLRHICTAEVSEARRGGPRKLKQCHSASGMPELASEAWSFGCWLEEGADVPQKDHASLAAHHT